jgi:hypothetical protein
MLIKFLSMNFFSGESNLVTLLLIVINIASKNPLILKDLIDYERKRTVMRRFVYREPEMTATI